MFTLNILGKYGPYPARNCATSSYLVKTSNINFTMDFGAGAFGKLMNYVEPNDLSFMILTHTHSDHTSDMGVMSYYLARNGKKMTVYMPKPETQEEILRFSSYSMCDFVYIDENTVVERDDLKITFTKLRHPVTNYGIRVSYNGKTFVYTGDTNTCENLDEFVKDSDYALMDACFLYKDWGESKPHLSVRHCAEICEKYNTKLIMTHLDEKYNEKDLLKEAKIYHKNSCVANEKGIYNLEK